MPGHRYNLERIPAGGADAEGLAGIGIVAVQDGRDIHIDNVALAEHPISGNPVADHLVDAHANAFRKSAIVERRWNGPPLEGKIVHDGVDRIGRNARPNVGFNAVQGFDDQLPGPADAVDLVGCFQPDVVFQGVVHIR